MVNVKERRLGIDLAARASLLDFALLGQKRLSSKQTGPPRYTVFKFGDAASRLWNAVLRAS
jgi:hypothetical protein